MNARQLAASLLLAATALAGCASQRPIETVRTSGDFYYNHDKFDLAAKEYGEIAQRKPGDWMAQQQLGRSLIHLQDYSQARRALEVAHTHRPNDETIIASLAEAMFLQGDENELFAFLRERAASTQSIYVTMLLGKYAADMGDVDSARVAFETAIQIDDGKSVEPYLAAADLAQRVGDLNLAVRRLSQAYGINPEDWRIKERLIALGEVPGPTLAQEPGR